jgi:hypothetical protein
MQLVPLTWHRTLGTIDEGGGGGGEEVAVANTRLVRIPRRTLPEPAAIQLYLARLVARKDGSPVRNRVAMGLHVDRGQCEITLFFPGFLFEKNKSKFNAC